MSNIIKTPRNCARVIGSWYHLHICASKCIHDFRNHKVTSLILMLWKRFEEQKISNKYFVWLIWLEYITFPSVTLFDWGMFNLFHIQELIILIDIFLFCKLIKMYEKYIMINVFTYVLYMISTCWQYFVCILWHKTSKW